MLVSVWEQSLKNKWLHSLLFVLHGFLDMCYYEGVSDKTQHLRIITNRDWMIL